MAFSLIGICFHLIRVRLPWLASVFLMPPTVWTIQKSLTSLIGC